MKMYSTVLGCALACAVGVAKADTVTVSFTALSGLTGGSPASTAVFGADLSSLLIGQIGSITIKDNSSTSAGSPGQFSGFDLDAIVLSSTLISNASQVGSLAQAGTFDFANSLLVAGAQTPPVDSDLFGTSGGHVDNAVATLNSFDGNSTTAIPGAFGFVSLGVGGELSINLTSPIATGGPLYLYIGEVGNNGEVAASNITISTTTIPNAPIPGAASLFGAAILALAVIRYGMKAKQFTA